MTLLTSPRDRDCPVCFAGVGEPCNAPTDTGRRDVRWYHFKRTESYNHDEVPTASYDFELCRDLRVVTRGRHAGTTLKCDRARRHRGEHRQIGKAAWSREYQSAVRWNSADVDDDPVYDEEDET
jgi:hypothetical protein